MVPDELLGLRVAPISTSSIELQAFLENLHIEEKGARAFELHMKGDGFTADIHCVWIPAAERLFLQVVPYIDTNDRTVSVSRVCASLATSLCSLAEELEASFVTLMIRKGQSAYATWMRSCLYVGFTVLSKSKSRRVLRDRTDAMVLKLRLGGEKDELSSDESIASTTDDSASEFCASPVSASASWRSSFGALDLSA